MTIGNFSPVLGSTNGDNLQANNLDIIYGLLGNDNLTTNDEDFISDDVAILVGGAGDDEYIVRENSTVVIQDSGLDNDNDTLNMLELSPGLLNKPYFTIDNGRHLYLTDPETDTNILLLDYQDSENQIESFELTNGTFLFSDLTFGVDADIEEGSPEFLGDFSFTELADPSIPEDARLDLASLGLTSATIDDDIQEIENTAIDFENTILPLDDISESLLTTSGSLEDTDNAYTFDGGEYFYDFYSLDSATFVEGDTVEFTLNSETFSTALFLLDSRGNVLEFENDSDGVDASENSVTNLSFTVPSNEPLFLSVESSDAATFGDYSLSFARTDSEEDSAPTAGTIQLNDSLTGEITTDDQSFTTVDGDLFFTDSINLVGDTPEEVRVSVESNFDAVLFVGEVDEEDNIQEIFEIDEADALGTESDSFVFDPDSEYRIFVDTFEPEATGGYTLTTETFDETVLPEEAIPEENSTPVEATIQTTDSFTGAITTDDALRFTETDDIFYVDAIDLAGDTPGEVRVSLESDFDGVLIVSEVGEDDITEQIFQTDEELSGAIETDTFLFDPDRRYRIFVDTFEAEETGDYTITTELL